MRLAYLRTWREGAPFEKRFRRMPRVFTASVQCPFLPAWPLKAADRKLVLANAATASYPRSQERGCVESSLPT
jgi:hypothetical protein